MYMGQVRECVGHVRECVGHVRGSVGHVLCIWVRYKEAWVMYEGALVMSCVSDRPLDPVDFPVWGAILHCTAAAANYYYLFQLLK